MLLIRFLCFFLSIFYFCNLAFALEEQPSNLLKLVPQDAMTVIMLRNKPDDVGMNTIKNNLKDRFSIEKSQERQQVVEEMTAMFNIKEVVGASFYAQGKKPLFILLISGGPQGQELIKAYSSKINILFNNPDEIWNKEYSGIKVIYNPERFQKADNKDFSCYAILDNNLIISNEFDLIKKLIDNFQNEGPSVLDSESFMQLPIVTDEEADGLIYISNQKNELSNSINSWKEEIGFVPLVSSDLINSLWFSFDVLSGDAARGRIVFVPKGGEASDKIVSDANFLISAMGRKFMADDINYKKSVDIVDGNVVLNFELHGLSGLWKKLIRDDFDEAGPIESSPKIVSDNTESQNGGFGALIFIILAIAVVIVLGYLKRKKSK